jgi:hypothetical protein
MSLDEPATPGRSIKVLVYEVEDGLRHDKLGEVLIEPNPDSREHHPELIASYLVSYRRAIGVSFAKIIGFPRAKSARELVVEAFRSLGFVK